MERIFQALILIWLASFALTDIASEKLFEKLMYSYDNLTRPVTNTSEVLTVKVKLRLMQVYDVHEKTQVLSTSMWIHQEWKDASLKWNPEHFEGIKSIYIPSQMIWRPDIVLYNSADGSPSVLTMTMAKVSYEGNVVWEPPALHHSLCQIDVTWFPFDLQTCTMKFGTWTYDGSQIDLIHWDSQHEAPEEEIEGSVRIWRLRRNQAIDLSEYHPSVEWDLVDLTGDKRWALYPCCPAPFVDITVKIHLRRKPLFYTVNLVGPCGGLALLSALSFQIPPDSHGKMGICASILVSTIVFFLLLVDLIPPNSLVIPLMAKYLLFTLTLVCISITFTVVSVNHHYRIPSTHQMPRWIRVWVLRRLAPLLGLKSIKSESTGLMAAVVGMVENSLRKDSVAARQALEAKAVHEVWERRTSLHPLLIQRQQSRAHLQENITDGKMAALKYVACSVALIAHNVRRQQQDRDLRDDWKHVARVIDRILLLLFLLTSTLVTGVIILQAPTLRDTRLPLVTNEHKF